MAYYLESKEWIVIHVIIWMNLRIIMLKDARQKKIHMLYDSSHSKLSRKYTLIYNDKKQF